MNLFYFFDNKKFISPIEKYSFFSKITYDILKPRHKKCLNMEEILKIILKIKTKYELYYLKNALESIFEKRCIIKKNIFSKILNVMDKFEEDIDICNRKDVSIYEQCYNILLKNCHHQIDEKNAYLYLRNMFISDQIIMKINYLEKNNNVEKIKHVETSNMFQLLKKEEIKYSLGILLIISMIIILTLIYYCLL